MMRALFKYVLILIAIWKVNAREVMQTYTYGEVDKDDFIIFYKHAISGGDLGGETVTFRFPQAGALHKFKITRMVVEDYNPYNAKIDLLSGGANEEYAEFTAHSPNSRQLDLEFFIYGIYEGACYRINKFENYIISLERKGYIEPLEIPIH